MKNPIARRNLLATTTMAVVGIPHADAPAPAPAPAVALPAATPRHPDTLVPFSVPHPANVQTPGNPYFIAVGEPFTAREAEDYARRLRSVSQEQLDSETPARGVVS